MTDAPSATADETVEETSPERPEGGESPDPDPAATVPTDSVDAALDTLGGEGLAGYNYAYLDEHTKREVRRAVLKAIAVPGHQVPYASRPMPLARGWGTGGIQASLSILGPDDTFKVIDQGSDESVNAANIRRLAADTADVATTTDTTEADVVQTRHRVPEEVLTDEQILVLQVPITDPLRKVDSSDAANRRRHAHRNYGKMWVHLYENVVEWGEIDIASRYPTVVAGRYLMDPSPIPRWDVPKLDDADNLFVFAAGREARIYAVPPHTDVEPLAFEDRSFQVERFPGTSCAACGSTDTYLVEVESDDGDVHYTCNDTSFCLKRRDDPSLPKDHHLDRSGVAWGPATGGVNALETGGADDDADGRDDDADARDGDADCGTGPPPAADEGGGSR